MTSTRSQLARNPLLTLPEMTVLQACDPIPRRALVRLLFELGRTAAEKAEQSWRKHKGPMAAYWRAVSVYARHTARALRRLHEEPARTLLQSERHAATDREKELELRLCMVLMWCEKTGEPRDGFRLRQEVLRARQLLGHTSPQDDLQRATALRVG